jgi:hypothetical protein
MKALKLAALLLVSASAAPAQVLIEGTVMNVDSSRLAGVRVEILDPAGQRLTEAMTDSAGEFTTRLGQPLQQGIYTLRSTMLGYQTTETQLEIADLEVIEVTLTMDIAAIPVEPLRVSARRRYARGLRDEFYDRADRVRRMGGGTIIGYDQLQRNPSAPVENIVRAHSASSATCPPAYFIDGLRVQPSDVRFLTVTSIEGIEIYRTELYHLPPRYQTGQGCPVVLIWTQIGDRGEGTPITWRRVLIGVGIIGAGVLLLR